MRKVAIPAFLLVTIALLGFAETARAQEGAQPQKQRTPSEAVLAN